LHDADVRRLAFLAEADQIEPLDARQRPLVSARQAGVERDCRRREVVPLRVDDGPRGRARRRARGGALGAAAGPLTGTSPFGKRVSAQTREAAKSVARYDTDIAEIKASLLLLKWMVGFTLAFVVALTWRVFQ